MIHKIPDIKYALREGILVNNPNHKDDQKLVQAFIRLRGQPSRPIDPVITPKSPDNFAYARNKLPDDFFDPFNELLSCANMLPIEVKPDLGAISQWNRRDFMPKLVSCISALLDEGHSPRLVPTLVWVFLNLERERFPAEDTWPSITAVAIPGSRTYDRAAEAFRAYIRSEGHAALITSGRAPYYDPDQSGYNITESEASAAYLRLLGVPPERIYHETESQDTTENADFLVEALEIIGSRPYKLVLTTSPFHLARYRFSVEMRLKDAGFDDVEIFSIGSKASRYWAETYFLADAKSGYTRETTMGVVFNEYLKLAFDMCAVRSFEKSVKAEAPR